jgi:hypothetical protein
LFGHEKGGAECPSSTININPMAAMKGGENKRTMKKKNLCISTLTYAATT